MLKKKANRATKSNPTMIKSPFWILFALSMVVADLASAQLKLHSRDQSSVTEGILSVSQNADELVGEGIAGKVHTIYKNGKKIGALHPDEWVGTVAGSSLYTIQRAPGYIAMQGKVKKYDISGLSMIETTSMTLPEQHSANFFNNGTIILSESDEGIGKLIKFYSSDLTLINEFSPFSTNYSDLRFSFFQNRVAILAMSQRPHVFLYKDTGERIGDFEVLTSYEAKMIIYGEKSIGIYAYDAGTKSMHIILYDLKGAVLGQTTIDSSVQSWEFTSGTTPVLVLATQTKILTIDTRNALVKESKLIKDIFQEGRSNSPAFVAVPQIKMLQNDWCSIVLAEPSGISTTKNDLLFLFKDNLTDRQILRVDGDGKPTQVKTASQQVLLSKGTNTFIYIYEK